MTAEQREEEAIEEMVERFNSYLEDGDKPMTMAEMAEIVSE